MAKYTSVVTMAAANAWTQLSAVANCFVTLHIGDSVEIAVADADTDIDTELTAGHRLTVRDRRLELKGLGTKKVFARGAATTQLIVTAYA